MIIRLCWEIVGLAWLAGMAVNGVQWLRGARTLRTGRGWDWLLAAALLTLFLSAPASSWRFAQFSRPWMTGVGTALMLAATAFTLWARWVLGTMWSSRPSVRQGHQLRTEGPYAVTRHPIYTGLLCMTLATALAGGLGEMLAVFVAGVVYVQLKLRQEERLMGQTFGEEYERYRRRVPQLVPGFGRLRPHG